jgi:hypothetical protein
MQTKLKSGLTRLRDHKLGNKGKFRRCNLCEKQFTQRTVFDRYCHTCKAESDLLKFSDWLPELDESVQEEISA